MGKISSTQIEQWGTNAIRDILSQTETLQHFVNENDKTPLWDGDVLIYNSSEWKNENIVGKVSIQIKAKMVEEKKLKCETISYRIKMIDLLKYKKNRGVIYFVVQINKENTTQHKVYYETLSPQKITSYTKGFEDQGSRNIKLKSLPEDKYKVQTIFYNFFENCSFGDIPPISLDELSTRKDVVKISSSFSVFLPKDNKLSPIDALFDNELYLKVKFLNCPIEIPIDIANMTELTLISKERSSILVDDVKYDNYMVKQLKKTTFILKFGESTTLTFYRNKKNVTIQYIPSDSLNNRMKDLNFLINMLETQKIFLDNNRFITLGSIVSNCRFDIVDAQKELAYYNHIDQFWKSLKIKKDFNLEKLKSNSSFKELNLVIDSFNGRRPVHIDLDGDYSYYLLKKKFSNFTLLLLLKRMNKSTYLIYNYFDIKGTISIVRNSVINITSKYSVLNPEDYIELSNLDFSQIIESYKSISQKNKNIFETANLDLLNLLLAYDKHNEHQSQILSTAKELAFWILNTSGSQIPDEIKVVNYLQVIKRDRELLDKENEKLLKISEKSKDLMVRISANLLLDNIKIARIQFGQLSDKNKNIFKSFPIYIYFQEFEINN